MIEMSRFGLPSASAGFSACDSQSTCQRAVGCSTRVGRCASGRCSLGKGQPTADWESADGLSIFIKVSKTDPAPPRVHQNGVRLGVRRLCVVEAYKQLRRMRSSPPRPRPRQKYQAKVQGPNEVQGQSTRPRRSTRTRKRHKNLPLSSTKRHMRRDRHADDRWPRMHQASASRRDANERRTTNRQQAEEVTRQHNHDRGRRAELCRAPRCSRCRTT